MWPSLIWDSQEPESNCMCCASCSRTQAQQQINAAAYSQHTAHEPCGLLLQPIIGGPEHHHACRREQVKACIARNAALGKMQQDACAAAFGEGFLSNQQQTSVLRTFVSMMQVQPC